MLRESLLGTCLLAASSFAELDAGWLQQAAIFIAATGAGVFYWKGALKGNSRAIEKLENRIDRFERELQEKFDDLNARSEARAKAYHDRINPLEATVSRVDATSEMHSQQIYAIENRLNSHIEKAQK